MESGNSDKLSPAQATVSGRMHQPYCTGHFLGGAPGLGGGRCSSESPPPNPPSVSPTVSFRGKVATDLAFAVELGGCCSH